MEERPPKEDKQIVLITGASSGIGNDIAKRLLNEKYTVYATDKRTGEMEELANSGAHVSFLEVTDEVSVKKNVDSIIEAHGQIDVLVNNAGWAYYTNIENGDIDIIKKMFEVNFYGYVRMIQQVMPHMRKRRSGTIINLSSAAGKVSAALQGWYSATKHAVEAMTDALRMETASFGIRVVLIEPGFVKTNIDKKIIQYLNETPHDDDYKPLFSNFSAMFPEIYNAGQTCDVVTDSVMAALSTEKPETRYVPTDDARDIIALKAAINDKEFDKAIMGSFGLS